MEDWLIGIIAGCSAIFVLLLVVALFTPLFGCQIGNTDRFAQTVPRGGNNQASIARARSRSAQPRGRATTASRNVSRTRSVGAAGKSTKKGAKDNKKQPQRDVEMGNVVIDEGLSTAPKL